MKNNSFGEVGISILLIILLFISLNPFRLFMPSVVEMTIVCVLVAVFGIFAIFMWREKIADEREGLHRLLASRAGFLVGGILLTLGILVQAIFHQAEDPWLKAALGGMVLAKIGALMYSRSKH
jgi:uncharacterized membrane protein YfcA